MKFNYQNHTRNIIQGRETTKISDAENQAGLTSPFFNKKLNLCMYQTRQHPCQLPNCRGACPTKSKKAFSSMIINKPQCAHFISPSRCQLLPVIPINWSFYFTINGKTKCCCSFPCSKEYNNLTENNFS